MDYEDDILNEEPDQVEAYCVRCRETVVMEEPNPVWTRKGIPATRGECPNCGGAVFRMGKTDAHGTRPTAVQVGGNTRARLPQETVYIACSPSDMSFAEQLADDLQKSGIANWVHGSSIEEETVNWAGGVHPALKECVRMVFVISSDALLDSSVEAAWRFFREKRKPIVIAMAGPISPPDDLRRSPRFDFSQGDYKAAFRQMIQALNQ